MKTVYLGLIFITLLTACSINSIEEQNISNSNLTTENQTSTNSIDIQLEVLPDNETMEETFLVNHVVDGDTFDISTGERVRLICVDTPETDEEGYQEAKDYMTELLLNQEVELVKDISETDRYGRLLRYVYLEDGTFVNAELVRLGYAEVYRYSPDTALCNEIEAVAPAEEIETNLNAEENNLNSDSASSSYECSSNIYNCDDFSSHAEAQEVFETCGGTSNDIHQLDGDQDGEACESLA